MLKTDKFLLIAHGSAEETTRAKAILAITEPESIDHHE